MAVYDMRRLARKLEPLETGSTVWRKAPLAFFGLLAKFRGVDTFKLSEKIPVIFYVKTSKLLANFEFNLEIFETNFFN